MYVLTFDLFLYHSCIIRDVLLGLPASLVNRSYWNEKMNRLIDGLGLTDCWATD